MEREHERDEFQQEIRRLEVQLKQTASVDNKGHRVRPINLIGSEHRQLKRKCLCLASTLYFCNLF